MTSGPTTNGESRDGFFFIVGSGRSGTTLLQSLLSAHPRLVVPPETHFLKRAVARGADRDDAPADFETFWRELTAWSRFADLGIPADEVRSRLGGAEGFREVFAAILKTYAAAHGAERVGEKTPSHYRHVQRLLGWYPDARILFVRRDPRAVVASHLSTPWVTGQLRPSSPLASFSRRLRLAHVAERAFLWREANGRFLGACTDDPRVKIVAYEDLVHAPGPIMASVCAFLGEDYVPEMVSGRSGEAESRDDGPAQDFKAWRRAHRAAAKAPVSGASLDKWKDVLSPFEVALIEAVCLTPMKDAGYAPVSSGPARAAGGTLASALRRGLLAEDLMRGMRVEY